MNYAWAIDQMKKGHAVGRPCLPEFAVVMNGVTTDEPALYAYYSDGFTKDWEPTEEDKAAEDWGLADSLAEKLKASSRAPQAVKNVEPPPQEPQAPDVGDEDPNAPVNEPAEAGDAALEAVDKIES